MAKEKEQKKKLIRVKGFKLERDMQKYLPKKFARFCFVSAPDTDRRQVTRFVSCRNCLHDYISMSIGVKPGGFTANAPIDLEKLRMLVQIGLDEEPKHQDIESYKERVFSAKRAINLIESKLGWESSTITTVVHEYFKPVWLITGPSNWMKSPAMLSLFTLVVRFIVLAKGIEASSTKELFEKMKESALKISNYKESEDVLACADKLEVLLENFNDIIREDPKDTYAITAGNELSFHHTGSITSLCEFGSNDRHANEKFKALWDTQK